MSADREPTAADYRRDAAAQVEEQNAGWRNETASDRHGAYIPDDRPTRRELEADEGDRWDW